MNKMFENGKGRSSSHMMCKVKVRISANVSIKCFLLGVGKRREAQNLCATLETQPEIADLWARKHFKFKKGPSETNYIAKPRRKS